MRKALTAMDEVAEVGMGEEQTEVPGKGEGKGEQESKGKSARPSKSGEI